jgi:hypothetical protein
MKKGTKKRVEIKIKNGKIHRKCIDCGKWTLKKRGYCRCTKCQQAWSKIQNGKRKRVYTGKNPHAEYMTKKVIKQQLKGHGPRMNDLFAGCNQKQIIALQTCNVNLLLRSNNQSERG